MTRVTRQIDRSRGVTLIEAVAAIITLSIAVPPLILLFSQVADKDVDVTYQQVAVFHAESLMEEIVSKEYEDPDLAAGSFGTEEGARNAYDDLDDFDGLSESPPARQNGDLLDDYGGFTRTATVDNVTAADPDPVSPAPDGSTEFKRIRVSVSWSGGKGGEFRLTTQRTRLSSGAPPGGGAAQDPLDEALSAASAYQNHTKEFHLLLVSISSSPAEVASFELSADQATSKLKELKLGSKKVWKGKQSLPTGIRSLNKGSTADRTIGAGASKDAHFKFNSNFASGTTNFTLVVHFTDSTSSTISFPVTW